MALDLDTRDQLIDTVRRFVAERLRPLEAQVSENDAIPDDVIEEMKTLGLYGLSIPAEFGGLDLTMEEEALVAVELGRTSPAFRSAFGTNVGIGSQGLVMFGTDEQKAKYLPGIASGEIITSFALTEPEAGSDSAAVQTRAVLDGDAYVLNGSKRFITNANKAHLFTVMARTDPSKPGGGGVSAFLVERNLPGLSVGKPEKKMGQQGAHICDVVFDNVRVPVENRLGREGEGFKVAMQVLDRGRLHISAVCIGVAERLIADCVAYASERKQFGQAISQFQLIQGMLADCKTEALAAKALTFETARKRDAGESVTMEAAAAKYFASEMVGRVADKAVQIFGGAGYIADYGIERFYRDVRIFRIYEGTSQIQQVVIAREVLKRGRLSMAIDMEAVILEVVGKLAPGKSASSEEVARAADPEGWRRLTGHVRNTARGLARQGKLVITRHGKPADPERFKGVYRLRLPTEAERLAAVEANAAAQQGDGE